MACWVTKGKHLLGPERRARRSVIAARRPGALRPGGEVRSSAAAVVGSRLKRVRWAEVLWLRFWRESGFPEQTTPRLKRRQLTPKRQRPSLLLRPPRPQPITLRARQTALPTRQIWRAARSIT